MPRYNAAIRVTYRGRNPNKPELAKWLEETYKRCASIASAGYSSAINNPSMVYGKFPEHGTMNSQDGSVYTIFPRITGRKKFLVYYSTILKKVVKRKRVSNHPGQEAQHFILKSVNENRDRIRYLIKRAGLDAGKVRDAINEGMLELKASLIENTPYHTYDNNHRRPADFKTMPRLRDNYRIVRARKR